MNEFYNNKDKYIYKVIEDDKALEYSKKYYNNISKLLKKKYFINTKAVIKILCITLLVSLIYVLIKYNIKDNLLYILLMLGALLLFVISYIVLLKIEKIKTTKKLLNEESYNLLTNFQEVVNETLNIDGFDIITIYFKNPYERIYNTMPLITYTLDNELYVSDLINIYKLPKIKEIVDINSQVTYNTLFTLQQKAYSKQKGKYLTTKSISAVVFEDDIMMLMNQADSLLLK